MGLGAVTSAGIGGAGGAVVPGAGAAGAGVGGGVVVDGAAGAGIVVLGVVDGVTGFGGTGAASEGIAVVLSTG